MRRAETHRQKRRIRDRSHVGQRALAAAECLVHRVEQHESFVPEQRTHNDEAVRIGDGKRPHDHGVEHREDRGGRADAQCQRQHGDGRERRARAEYANGIPQILNRVIDQAQAARVATVLLDALGAAEHQPRPSAGLAFAQAGGRELLDLPLQVEPKFVVELVLDSIAAEKRAQADAKIAQQALPPAP